MHSVLFREIKNRLEGMYSYVDISHQQPVLHKKPISIIFEKRKII